MSNGHYSLLPENSKYDHNSLECILHNNFCMDAILIWPNLFWNIKARSTYASNHQYDFVLFSRQLYFKMKFSTVPRFTQHNILSFLLVVFAIANAETELRQNDDAPYGNISIFSRRIFKGKSNCLILPLFDSFLEYN